MSEPIKKTNYLNNRDLLKQIHISKNSYCSYLDKEHDHNYDIILDSLGQLNQTVIDQAKKNKSAKVQKETGEYYNPATIPTTSLVFRVMTYEHVPMIPKKKNTKILPASVTDYADDLNINMDLLESEELFDTPFDRYDAQLELEPEAMVHVRCNFPPFKHYRLDEHNIPYPVGISHWKGDFETGEFSVKHGQITDELSRMFIKLCERYATRSNWRGYSYKDEMQGNALVQLCQFGLFFNEAKSQNPFAYFTAILSNSFTGVLNTEKRMQGIRDDILEQNGMAPSWTRQFKNHNMDSVYSSSDEI